MLNYKLNKNIFICTIQTTIAHRELRHRPTTHSYDHHLNMPLLCGIHPHTRANINKVESIQRRAARFVTNNYDPRASVTTLLQDLNCPTLQHRRELAKLVMMYRITYHLISKYHLVTYLIPSRSGTRGHNICYLQPSTRVLAYQYSFFPNTIRLWNNLPQTLVSSGSIDIFRHSLTNTSLP